MLEILIVDDEPTNIRLLTEVLKQEEERFFQTITNGMEILESALANSSKVIDGETGFAYHDNSSDALAEAIERAVEVYYDQKIMRNMQKKAIQNIEEQHTWGTVMGHYQQLYKKTMKYPR